jgi:dTDP-glucose 4,6-dehydratase
MNFSNINLLITGGCGFIGSNYINHIFDKVNLVVNLDAMYYCASENNITKNIRDSNNYYLYKKNLNNLELMKHILSKHNITHIVHFAAQSHVDNSFDNSLQYTYDNVQGTHTLVEAIRLTNLNIILLHFSTDEVYGESGNDEKTEESLLCPTNPYAASKAAAEMYVYSYIYSFGLKAIISRGNNIYGNNQYPEKLIPKFIKLLREGKKCTIHGKGETVRNFINVIDVCNAVDIILSKGCFGQVYNIGGDTSNEFSVMDVASKIIILVKNDTNIDNYIEYVKDRPFNDKRYLISNKKLVDLGWEQKISFDDGLKMLVNTNNSYNIIIRQCPNDKKYNLWLNKYKDIENKIIISNDNYNKDFKLDKINLFSILKVIKDNNILFEKIYNYNIVKTNTTNYKIKQYVNINDIEYPDEIDINIINNDIINRLNIFDNYIDSDYELFIIIYNIYNDNN